MKKIAKNNLKILALIILSLLPLRASYAVFALETTMQLQIGPELAGIKGAVVGVAPAIVKANVAIGKSIISAIHKTGRDVGLASAEMQARREFGGQSVRAPLCENSEFANTLFHANSRQTDLTHSTTKWFEDEVLDTFTNRSASTFFTHSSIKDITPNRETLIPPGDVYPIATWGKTASYNLLMLTPEAPIKLSEDQINTQAGKQYDAYQKLYDGRQAYVNAVFADDASQLTGTIDVDEWLSTTGNIVPENMIKAMQNDKRNLVQDPDSGKWVMSKKSALKVLSEARINNETWWADVSQKKAIAWVQREQTILSALQLEATVRIIDKLDHLIKLSALSTQESAVEPMRHRLKQLGESAKTQVQRNGK